MNPSLNAEALNKIKQDLKIPDYVKNKLVELGITELPEMKILIMQYITESDTANIDWFYFNNWVAMGYSDH